MPYSYLQEHLIYLPKGFLDKSDLKNDLHYQWLLENLGNVKHHTLGPVLYPWHAKHLHLKWMYVVNWLQLILTRLLSYLLSGTVLTFLQEPHISDYSQPDIPIYRYYLISNPILSKAYTKNYQQCFLMHLNPKNLRLRYLKYLLSNRVFRHLIHDLKYSLKLILSWSNELIVK